MHFIRNYLNYLILVYENLGISEDYEYLSNKLVEIF